MAFFTEPVWPGPKANGFIIIHEKQFPLKRSDGSCYFDFVSELDEQGRAKIRENLFSFTGRRAIWGTLSIQANLSYFSRSACKSIEHVIDSDGWAHLVPKLHDYSWQVALPLK